MTIDASEIFSWMGRLRAAGFSFAGAPAVCFDLGPDGCWCFDPQGEPAVREGRNEQGVRLQLGAEDLAGVLCGELNAQQLYLSGKLRVHGPLGDLLRCNLLLDQLQKVAEDPACRPPVFRRGA